MTKRSTEILSFGNLLRDICQNLSGGNRPAYQNVVFSVSNLFMIILNVALIFISSWSTIQEYIPIDMLMLVKLDTHSALFSTWINLLKFFPLGLEFHEEFMYWEVGMATDPVPTEALLGKISGRPASANICLLENICLSQKWCTISVSKSC